MQLEANHSGMSGARVWAALSCLWITLIRCRPEYAPCAKTSAQLDSTHAQETVHDKERDGGGRGGWGGEEHRMGACFSLLYTTCRFVVLAHPLTTHTSTLPLKTVLYVLRAGLRHHGKHAAISPPVTSLIVCIRPWDHDVRRSRLAAALCRHASPSSHFEAAGGDPKKAKSGTIF